MSCIDFVCFLLVAGSTTPFYDYRYTIYDYSASAIDLPFGKHPSDDRRPVLVEEGLAGVLAHQYVVERHGAGQGREGAVVRGQLEGKGALVEVQGQGQINFANLIPGLALGGC